MILTEQELSSAFHGATRVLSENGRVYPCRFTEKQSAYYAEKSEEYYHKSFAAASVTLEFVTDASIIEFDYLFQRIAGRLYCGVDLYVDDIMTGHHEDAFKNYSQMETVGHAEFALPHGTHRITLYLPNLVIAKLSNFTLTGAEIFEPVPERDRKFFLIGDSITQGYDALYPSMSYANRLARFMDAEVINNAIGGEKFDGNILTDDITYDPELVLVAYGTNAWNGAPSLAALLESAEGFFKRIREVFPKAQFAYISPIWRKDRDRIMKAGDFDTCRAKLIALAEQYGFYHIDGLKLVPHLPAFYWDGYLHPNDMGFSFYAENLIKALCEIK